MKLSIIIPSIRPDNLFGLYYSIKESFSEEFEMIVISPFQMIPEFDNNYDIKWIISKSHPTVCQQLGLIQARGEYVCFGWDDGVYLPGAIDKMFEQLEQNSAVSGKYIEGDIAPGFMASHEYYIINNHNAASSPYITNDFLLFNTGIVARETLLNIGGFDCRFESTAISALDLAIRLQLFGVKVILSKDVVLKCSWLPGDQGDHGPINEAVQDDLSLLHKKYRQPILNKKIVFDINNWKEQPAIWQKRFSNV